jgi:hypothetical protein
MTAHDDLDRQLTDFLRDGPEELPYQSFDAVRDLTEQTGQRVVIGPWRLPEMNKIVTIGLSAAAVVILVFLGAQLFGSPSGGTGDSPDPTATPEPTATVEPTATPEPAPSEAAAPPLTQSFTSTQHGITVSYPEGWTAQAATEPWTGDSFPLEWGAPHADWLSEPTLTHNLFLAIASQSIGDATPEEWMTGQLANYDDPCGATAPIEIDGAQGLIGEDRFCEVAVVITDGRGYWIQLYTSEDDPAAVAAYDRAWFEQVLATVQLQPEDAVD